MTMKLKTFIIIGVIVVMVMLFADRFDKPVTFESWVKVRGDFYPMIHRTATLGKDTTYGVPYYWDSSYIYFGRFYYVQSDSSVSSDSFTANHIVLGGVPLIGSGVMTGSDIMDSLNNATRTVELQWEFDSATTFNYAVNIESLIVKGETNLGDATTDTVTITGVTKTIPFTATARGFKTFGANKTRDTTVISGVTMSDYFFLQWRGITIDPTAPLFHIAKTDTLIVGCVVADTARARSSGYNWFRIK
jgi:hypothetical protein